MKATFLILILLTYLFVSYKLYKPRVVIVRLFTRKIVTLEYNLYIDGHLTKRRTFIKLFTL